MNTQALSHHSMRCLLLLLRINFNASVIIVLVAGIMTLTGSELFFRNTVDLYGPLANNLRWVLMYLCLVQLAVYGFYQFSQNYAAVFALGGFILLLILSLEYYSSINQIEIDDNFEPFLLYTGLSHVLYGGLQILQQPRR
ncbi:MULTISPECIES: hypothetical protein [Methylomonas]|uniref:hypothetical protein n=1 Tax=Methylomonas TaxID=416 RepID=UPI0012324A5C|nr:hypothetical protein [Methylomonas rhizoryzae]